MVIPQTLLQNTWHACACELVTPLNNCDEIAQTAISLNCAGPQVFDVYNKHCGQ